MALTQLALIILASFPLAARAFDCAQLRPTDSIGWLDGRYCEAVGTLARDFDTRDAFEDSGYGTSSLYLEGQPLAWADSRGKDRALLYIFAWHDTDQPQVVKAGTIATFHFVDFNGPSLRAVPDSSQPVNLHLYTYFNESLVGTIGDFQRAAQGIFDLKIQGVKKP